METMCNSEGTKIQYKQNIKAFIIIAILNLLEYNNKIITTRLKITYSLTTNDIFINY